MKTEKPKLTWKELLKQSPPVQLLAANDGLTAKLIERAGFSACQIGGFVTIIDVDRAKFFHRDKLGPPLLSEEIPFALVFDANGITLRLAVSKDATPSRGTALGWQVPDLTAAVKD